VRDLCGAFLAWKGLSRRDRVGLFARLSGLRLRRAGLSLDSVGSVARRRTLTRGRGGLPIRWRFRDSRAVVPKEARAIGPVAVLPSGALPSRRPTHTAGGARSPGSVGCDE
jgi:hypothetical protein